MTKPRKIVKGKSRAKNPAFSSSFPTIMDEAGTLIVNAALVGSTFEEKALVATMIPILLKVIRTVPRGEVKQTVGRIWQDPSSAKKSTEPTPQVEPTFKKNWPTRKPSPLLKLGRNP